MFSNVLRLHKIRHKLKIQKELLNAGKKRSDSIKGDPRFGFCDGPITVTWRTDDPRNSYLAKSCTFEDIHGQIWVGFDNDKINGASVSWFFRRVFPPYIGKYRRATVFHDVACMRRTSRSRIVHRMFYEAMRCDGVSVWKAFLMWAVVRFLGPKF